MWGPNVKLWQTLEEIEGSAAFQGRFSPRDRYTPDMKSYLANFLFDEEGAHDLQIGTQKVSRHEEDRKERDPEKTLLVNGGLIDLTFNHARNPSHISRQMLEKVFLVPGRSEQEIKERQKIFELLKDLDLREKVKMGFSRLDSESRTSKRDNYSGGQRPFLDDAERLTHPDDRYLSEFPKYLHDLKLFTFLINSVSALPEFKYVFENMRLSSPGDFSKFNDFVSSKEHHMSLDKDFSPTSLRWKNSPSKDDLSAFDLQGETTDDRSKEAEFQRRGAEAFAYFVVNTYASNVGRDFSACVRNLATFEACVHLADFAFGGRTRCNWTLPEIVESDEPFIEINNFVHPSYMRENVVVNGLKIKGKNLVNVLTGANDGGKTQTLRAVGQLVALAQAGFPIPAEYARMSRFDNILTNFAGKDDAAKGRYRRALSRWMDVLNYAGNKSLVLTDEPTDGTFPETGIKHGIMALKALEKRNSAVLITTHYHDIAKAVEEGEVPRSGNMHVVTKVKGDGSLDHTYQVERGMDGRSYGDEMAKQVGFTEERIQKIRQEDLREEQEYIPF